MGGFAASARYRRSASDSNPRQRAQRDYAAVARLGMGANFSKCTAPRSYTGLEGAGIYEINLPHERTPITDDRTIRGEVCTPAESKKTSEELEHMRRVLGINR
jgi:hypothetical protein